MTYCMPHAPMGMGEFYLFPEFVATQPVLGSPQKYLVSHTELMSNPDCYWSRSRLPNFTTTGVTYPAITPPIDCETGKLDPEWVGQALIDPGMNIDDDFQRLHYRLNLMHNLMWPALHWHKARYPNRDSFGEPGKGFWHASDIRGMIAWAKVLFCAPGAAGHPLLDPSGAWYHCLGTSIWIATETFDGIGYNIFRQGNRMLRKPNGNLAIKKMEPTPPMEQQFIDKVLECVNSYPGRFHLEYREDGSISMTNTEPPLIFPGEGDFEEAMMALIEKEKESK